MKAKSVIVTMFILMSFLTVSATFASQGAILFEDNFDGTALDPNIWHAQENAGGYGPALHFDANLPYVDNGYARLPLETYDPQYPGQMVRGSYLQAGGPDAGDVKRFMYHYGAIRTEVRFRIVNPLDGQTTSLTYYGSSTGGGSDEMDYEYQAGEPDANALWLSTWESWDHDGRVDFNYPDLAGILNSPPEWNTYRLDWNEGEAEFYLNDRLLWTSTNYVPDDGMGLKLTNFIYSGSVLTPVSDPCQNSVAYYDVDYVRVSQLDDNGDIWPDNILLADSFYYHSAAEVSDINLDLPQRQLGSLAKISNVGYVESGTPDYVTDGEAVLDSFNIPPRCLELLTGMASQSQEVTVDYDFNNYLAGDKVLHISVKMNPDRMNGTSDPNNNYGWMSIGGYQDGPGSPGSVAVTMRNNGSWYFDVDTDSVSGSVPFVDEQWHKWDIYITKISEDEKLIDVELDGELVVGDYLLNDPNWSEAYINFGGYSYTLEQRTFAFDDLTVSTVESEKSNEVVFQNGSAGYVGTEDNYMLNYDTTLLTGSEGFFYIGRPWDPTHIAHSLIRFNGLEGLQGKYQTIDTAKVVLTVAYADGELAGGYDMTIHEVLEDNEEWIESQSCWSYKRYDWPNPEAQWAGGLLGSPVYGCGAADVDYVSMPMDTVAASPADADGDLIEFEIDPLLVEQWVEGGVNAGMLLKTELLSDTYRRGFYSSEYSNVAWRPKLVVTYTPVEGTAIAGLQEGVKGYAGTEDNYMLNYNGSTNFGSDNFFFIGRPWNPTHIARTILRFNGLTDLQDKFQYVTSAKLVLRAAYADGSLAGGFDMSLHEVLPENIEWIEDDCSWSYKRNSWSSDYDWAGAPADYGCGVEGVDHGAAMDTVTALSTDADGDIIEFNVNPMLIEYWINGGANAGMLLKTELLNNDYRRGFYSSDYSNAAWRPQLLITYVPKQGPAQASFRQGKNSYSGAEDAYMKNWETNERTGSEQFFYIGRPSDPSHIARSLLRFDGLDGLQGIYKSIDSAKVVLTTAYADGSLAGGFDMSLHEVLPANVEWDENDSSWSYKRNSWSSDYDWAGAPADYGCGAPAVDYVTYPMSAVSAKANDADGDVIEFSVDPELVEQWIQGGTNAGILLKTELYDNIYRRGFYSSNDSHIDWRPQLVVSYTPDVNYDYLELFAGKWLDTGCDTDNDWCGSCDWTRDNAVNFKDFAELAQLWISQ